MLHVVCMQINCCKYIFERNVYCNCTVFWPFLFVSFLFFSPFLFFPLFYFSSFPESGWFRKKVLYVSYVPVSHRNSYNQPGTGKPYKDRAWTKWTEWYDCACFLPFWLNCVNQKSIVGEGFHACSIELEQRFNEILIHFDPAMWA